MSVKRSSLVASNDDPLSMLGGGGGSGSVRPSSLETVSETSSANGLTAPSTNLFTTPTGGRAASQSVSGRTPQLASDPDDIVVDSERQRVIATRAERKEHAPLYVGSSTSTSNSSIASPPSAVSTRPSSQSTSARVAHIEGPADGFIPPVSPVSPTAASSSVASSAAATATNGPTRRSSTFKSTILPLRSRDWNPSLELTKECLDDWDSHSRIPGEKSVMQIPDVLSYNAHDEPTQVLHALFGTLYMTSYQLFLEPTQRRDRLSQAVQSVPLSTIDRIEIEKSRGGGGSSIPGSPLGPYHLLNFLDIYSKDGRFIKFGFMKFDECKRAYDCLQQYVFPPKEEYLFAFYYRIKTPIPAHLDGWNLYDPIEEFKRQGINTIPLAAPASVQSEGLRLSWANEAYTVCSTYPRVFVVPSEKYVTDLDLHMVAQFRSRGRIPVMTWKHPTARQTIWRCAQPKVGMNNARCGEDEKLLSAITNFAAHGEVFAIYDARPKFNARANILAGKGFENPELYRNCVKKIFFQNIENIHVMRASYVTLVKACQREVHDAQFLVQVNQSGWLNHISTVLKGTAEMVKAIDQDKISLLIHCSDGWDRTAQLAALCQLCLDPFYRTTKGFFILIEKEWISFGHQFQRRTGHKDRNYTDDQRSCIFLQWCDCVWQLLQQFPRHFEFNSHLLVTMVHHLYSCRFGTFFYNSDMARRKNKIHEKTVSLWTYFMCSPAAIAGEFTNQLYAPSGNGMPNWGLQRANSVKRHQHQQQPSPSTPQAQSSNTPAAAPAPPANETPAEEIGKSSVGRGGGDNSTLPIGSVLYPSWSLKKISLWSDYFLRWSNDQMEQVPCLAPTAGSVPPGGSCTPRITSVEPVLHAEVRRVTRENKHLTTQVGQQTNRIKELEAELAALKAQFESSDASGLNNALVSALIDDSLSFDSLNVTSPVLQQAPTSSPPSAASALIEGEEDGSEEARAAEAAQLEELKKRLHKEVDVNVPEETDGPEDPTTL